MTTLMVPNDGETLWPTLGPQVCQFIEDHLVHGPGDLRGEPARLDNEKRALIYRAYEVYPKGHREAGRRRFKRVGLSLCKGLAKTEMAAWIAAAELHPEAPVRCVRFDRGGNPIGGAVADPYIPLCAYTEEQSDELCYGALKAILEESELRESFDIGLQRIMRVNGDGKAVSLSAAPNSRDGARTTFSVFDEPLALDTPVPTTGGWKTIGEIRSGDHVYDRLGKPVRVVGESETHEGRTCFRVTFTDGDSIVTDERHRWKAVDKSNPPAGEVVVTTREMYERGTDTSHGKRWRLPRHSGFDGSEKALPLEPYFLGLWLGNGDSRNATICFGEDDIEEIGQLITDLGFVVTKCSVKNRAPLIYVTYRDSSRSGWGVATGKPAESRSVVGSLRDMGLLLNKRIPADYLFASRPQRVALLQGLMDSDGHVTVRGNCTFSQGRKALIEQVRELVESLGTPARITETADERAREGSTWKLHFSPDFCAFRLRRKAIRSRPGSRPTWLPTIELIEPCESVPVKCIAVDSPDHLFLAGHRLRLTHNTHHWSLPRLKKAHQTMLANLPKRKAADAWALEITTAPEPGMGSVAEATMEYARAVQDGRAKDARLFYFHREASDEHDLTTKKGARAAVVEASGEAAKWRDIDAIVALWEDPTTDRKFWERVWLNRLVQASAQAFDAELFKSLTVSDSPVSDGCLITLGFDGALFNDSTALVGTHVESGYQWLVGVWEAPYGDVDWQVPEEEVDDLVDAMFKRYDVWRLYADPPYWQSWIAQWSSRYGPERIIEWWTNRRKQMTHALENFDTAMRQGALSHGGDEVLMRHVANARRHDLPQLDAEGRHAWLIRKERSDSPLKIDAAMAAVLSWEARTDAIRAGELQDSGWVPVNSEEVSDPEPEEEMSDNADTFISIDMR